MANILKRFGEIMESNIHAALDKLEDPSKMVDQMLREASENLAELRKDTARVAADAKLSKQKVDECKAEIEKCQRAAANALRSGNEAVARDALQKKQRQEANLIELEKIAAANTADAEKATEMHNKLVDDINYLKGQKDIIKSKANRAKAQSTRNKILAGSGSSRKAIDAFGRMNEKADRMLAEAEAEAELSAGVDNSDALIEQYAAGGSADVDDELARMKAELGIQ